ncbi:MAG: ligase [Rhodoferax sp.]|nr:ligase [Rhodoferax sp.]
MLGCAQRPLRADIEQRLAGRAELLVRESGGGAVLTGPWLVSVSVVLPLGHPWVCEGLLDSYRRLGQLHVAALTEFGVSARVVPPRELSSASDAIGVGAVDWACFGGLSPWELVNPEGRKLVGLAQRKRQTGVLLVAGTLIGASDWSLLCDLMGQPQDVSMLQRRTVSAQELAGGPIEAERFASVLRRRLDQAFPASAAAGDSSF